MLQGLSAVCPGSRILINPYVSITYPPGISCSSYVPCPAHYGVRASCALMERDGSNVFIRRTANCVCPPPFDSTCCFVLCSAVLHTSSKIWFSALTNNSTARSQINHVYQKQKKTQLTIRFTYCNLFHCIMTLCVFKWNGNFLQIKNTTFSKWSTFYANTLYLISRESVFILKGFANPLLERTLMK